MAILPKGSEVPTIVEGAEEGATFQVEVSAHLMSLLAGLYSKREDSIVREVLCNAYDAQKSIGVTAPVVIEAPSALSPVLKIRDKGPGMSKETVFRVYASYGTSTKGGSNEQTGGMGVGAKAVFCYTDTFTVISCYDGMESTYVAYADGETGIPRIDLMATVPCPASKTGVEVQVPVQLNDIETFNTAISWNGQFHPVAPVVVGGASVEVVFDTMPITLDLTPYGAPGWTAYPGWTGEHGVVMGSVFYPLTQELPQIGLPVLYEAPMGSVRFAPSREALKYDEVTVANLKAANKALRGAFEAWVLGLVSSAETRLPGLLGSQNKVLAAMAQGPLSRILTAPVLTSLMGAAVAHRFHPQTFLVSSLPWSIMGSLYFFDPTGCRREAATDKPRLTVNLTATEVWVCDCTGGETRLRRAMDAKTVKLSVFYTREESTALALAAHLGFDVESFVKYTSSLPEVEKASREKLKLSGRIGGTFNVYPDASLVKAYSSMDGDKALELTQCVYVEAALGGYDWRSVSTSGKLTLTMKSQLEVATTASPWVPEPVKTAVLRLNGADREKLKKKGYTLVPLADLVEEALDAEAVERAARDWKVLNEENWHLTYPNNIKSILWAWDATPLKLQALLLERLNEVDEGLGDLLEEAVTRKGLWRAPSGMTTTNYAGLKAKVAALPIWRPREASLLSRLSEALGNLDISRLGMPSTSNRTYMAGIYAMCGALEIPEAVLGRTLCPAPVAAPRRTKASVSALPGQLSLFTEDAEEDDEVDASAVMRAAA